MWHPSVQVTHSPSKWSVPSEWRSFLFKYLLSQISRKREKVSWGGWGGPARFRVGQPFLTTSNFEIYTFPQTQKLFRVSQQCMFLWTVEGNQNKCRNPTQPQSGGRPWTLLLWGDELSHLCDTCFLNMIGHSDTPYVCRLQRFLKNYQKNM